MKKVLLIMAAALLMMTQCRKPETPSADTIKMTVTVGPGAKTDITDNGAITWSEDDVLYVSDGTKWLGSLDLQSGAGNATGTFTGEISAIDDGKTCHFFYLGRDNGMTGATANTTTNAVISFASQDGTREGAFNYHLGHGSAEVTVSGDVATGAVSMRTEIAIAHLKLKMNGEDYTGSVTMDVSNTMTVSPDGTFSGSGNGNGIAIGNGDGEHGDRYVTLIPTGTESVEVSFRGSATGSMTFGHGIQANNLYGMANGIEVSLEAASAPKFSVGVNTTVEFSPGNLYWDGSAFHFEADQWSFADTWNASHVSLFKWSNTANAVTGDNNYSGDLFCASNFTVTGDSHTWRTLTNSEWKYLLNTSNASSGARTDANRFAKARVSGVAGLLVFPDGYNGGAAIGSITGVAALNTTNAAYPTESIPDATWTSMEAHGVVFLPAAGYRDGTGVIDVGSYGYYWSSTPRGSSRAYYVYFESSYVSTNSGIRGSGISVRLVRSAS